MAGYGRFHLRGVWYGCISEHKAIDIWTRIHYLRSWFMPIGDTRDRKDDMTRDTVIDKYSRADILSELDARRRKNIHQRREGRCESDSDVPPVAMRDGQRIPTQWTEYV